MGIFKKEQAVFIEKMNTLSNVTISDNKIKFELQYSSISLSLTDIPKLMGDVIELYGLVKPTLDKLSIEAEEERKKSEDIDTDDKPIDLSEVPF